MTMLNDKLKPYVESSTSVDWGNLGRKQETKKVNLLTVIIMLCVITALTIYLGVKL